MKKLYRILNCKEEDILLDSKDVLEKYYVNDKILLMKDEAIYFLWSLLIKEDNENNIEKDFFEFIYNKLPYSDDIRFIGSRCNTESCAYYTKEELKELIKEYSYIYKSGHDGIIDSKCLLNFSTVLTYQYDKGYGFIPEARVLVIEECTK